MSTQKFRAKLIQRLPARFQLEDGRKVACLTQTDDPENDKARYVMIRKTNVHHSNEYGYEVYSIRSDQAWYHIGKAKLVAWYGNCRRVGIFLGA